MSLHQSVLLSEALGFLQVKPGGRYIDATYGGGGHTREILSRGGQVLGLDVSPQAVEAADQDPNLKLVQGNFSRIAGIAGEKGWNEVDGILFDLGISSDELEQVPGMSFRRDEPLDMRLDPSLGVTAADLINALPESKLVELFETFGDEHYGRPLAAAIKQARQQKKIETSGELVQIIERVKRSKFERVHPATQVFQALRIAVNDELDTLQQALPQADSLLKVGGRLVVISFHSGEDRIVKNFLKSSDLKSLTDKPVIPGPEEVATNPRSRSAKLRAAEKI